MFHQTGVPVLVSSTILRQRSLGQVDLARLVRSREGWRLEIEEVKSSKLGEEQFMKGQKKRLMASLHFLAALLGLPSRLLTYSGDDPE